MIRAVLFDVGGPIDTEVLHEAGVDRGIMAAFAAHGIDLSQTALDDASQAAVSAFAPNTYRAMVWTLARRNEALARAVWAHFKERDGARAAARGGVELRPGISELLGDLYQRGLKLGLAANQPVRAVSELDRHGIGRWFAHREVSGHHGFHKPDVRLFLRACDDLGVGPEQTIMVGDRIDNDVVPAALLGMKTVLFRTGRHIGQQPRSIDEVPDAEVRDVTELKASLDLLLADS